MLLQNPAVLLNLHIQVDLLPYCSSASCLWVKTPFSLGERFVVDDCEFLFESSLAKCPKQLGSFLPRWQVVTYCH